MAHSKQMRGTPPPRPNLSPRWKWLISGLVILHLLAVVAEPFRFFTRSRRGTSPAADPARLWLAPYIEFGYLNHGYFFFAPEPGPSHLMECRLTLPDDRQVALIFPDKKKQWPRLLYHRHFMLAEFLHQLHVPPFEAEVVGGDDRFARDWQAERSLFESVRASMSQHVATKFGAETARIERLEHRLPSDDEVFRLRLPLDSPTLYIALPDAPFDPPPSSLTPGTLMPGGLTPGGVVPEFLSPPTLQPGQGVLRHPETAPAGQQAIPSAGPSPNLRGEGVPVRDVPGEEIQP